MQIFVLIRYLVLVIELIRGIAVLVPPICLNELIIRVNSVSVGEHDHVQQRDYHDVDYFVQSLVLRRFGQILQHVDADRSDYEYLVENEDESVELLRVRSVNDVVEQKDEGHRGQDVERVLLSVVDGQNEDEGRLVDEVDGRVELLHQHREEQDAREAAVQDHPADHGGDDGDGHDAAEDVELLRHDAVAALHGRHLQHEREHDQEHAHEGHHKEHSLEDEVVDFGRRRPFAFVLDLVVLGDRLGQLALVVVLFEFEEQAHDNGCHQHNVHHIEGQQELLLQPDRGQTEGEGVCAGVVDALCLVVARRVPEHL